MTSINQLEHYRQQLLDKRWAEKRLEILARDKHRCRCCKQTKDLQVHHRQYHYCELTGNWKAPWAYTSELLITVCDSCHQQGHTLFKVPAFAIKVARNTRPAHRLHAW